MPQLRHLVSCAKSPFLNFKKKPKIDDKDRKGDGQTVGFFYPVTITEIPSTATNSAPLKLGPGVTTYNSTSDFTFIARFQRVFYTVFYLLNKVETVSLMEVESNISPLKSCIDHVYKRNRRLLQTSWPPYGSIVEALFDLPTYEKVVCYGKKTNNEYQVENDIAMVFFAQPGLCAVLRTLTQHDTEPHETEHILKDFARRLSSILRKMGISAWAPSQGDDISGIDTLVTLLDLILQYIHFVEVVRLWGSETARTQLTLKLLKCMFAFDAWLKTDFIPDWHGSVRDWCENLPLVPDIQSNPLQLKHTTRLALYVISIMCAGDVKLLNHRIMDHFLQDKCGEEKKQILHHLKKSSQTIIDRPNSDKS